MDNERIAIRGTVTRDPELSTTPKGKIYTRINVAADEVTIGGNKVNASENKYQSVVFWGVDAVDKVKEVKQGAQVAVHGPACRPAGRGAGRSDAGLLRDPPRIADDREAAAREGPGRRRRDEGRGALRPGAEGGAGQHGEVLHRRDDPARQRQRQGAGGLLR